MGPVIFDIIRGLGLMVVILFIAVIGSMITDWLGDR
jgi:hypothetical protein